MHKLNNAEKEREEFYNNLRNKETIIKEESHKFERENNNIKENESERYEKEYECHLKTKSKLKDYECKLFHLFITVSYIN